MVTLSACTTVSIIMVVIRSYSGVALAFLRHGECRRKDSMAVWEDEGRGYIAASGRTGSCFRIFVSE